jgi:uncharacterized protein (DUF58 family)
MNSVRLAALHTWLRSRIRYRVTRGGALFALAVALTGAGAFASANNLLFLVFSAMMALLLVSGFLSRLVLAGLELELLLPEHVSARVSTPARVRLRNVKRLTPSFSIELSGAPGAVNREPSILSEPLYFPLVPGKATIEGAVEVRFPHRGRHRENLFELSTRFPFGFLRKTTTVALRRETIVYPALEPEGDSQAVFDRLAGEIEMNVRGSGQDFHRIRPYETSDGARMVDWKSSAHSGTLQVREFSREQQRAVEIFLDRRIAPGDAAAFERAVERCAFVVWELSGRDVELRFHSQRFSLAIPEEGEVYVILRFLALAEPMVTSGLPAGSEKDAELDPDDPASLRIVFSASAAGFES